MKSLSKTVIVKNTISRREYSNVFNYYFETENFIFSTSDQRVLVENKNTSGIVKQYGDATNKKEFVDNVFEYLKDLN